MEMENLADMESSRTLPERMFALGEEPVGVRVTPYHKPFAISNILRSLEEDEVDALRRSLEEDVVDALRRSLEEDEVDALRRSPFGKLVEIAEKPTFSGRFGRYIISRQLKVKKKHEAWFLFASKPIRFSLREFAIVTCLNFFKYPARSKKKAKRDINEKPYWGELFGTMKEVSVNCVVRMLKKRSVTAKETRIKYAFLALLASVVLPTTHTPRISHEHAEKIKDLDAFLAYPRGRVSFELLISSIKERNELSLSQNTIALKGFVLALQLVMIEAVPALTEAVHEAGSSGSEGDFADDELSEEERKGKRSISPGHARDTDCSGKAGVVSIISVGNEAVNGDSQFGWSDDEEDVDVVRMREETRSEAEIRKTTKQKSNQSSGDVVDADSIASCVKGRLSGDLSRVSEDLNRVSAEVSRMATELKSFGAAFTSFQTAIVSKVDDMLKTFNGQTVQNITNPMIHSPAPAMQHVPPPIAVRRTGEDQSKYSHVGVNDVVNQPTASSHGGLDASKIIERIEVETVGVNPTMHTIGSARVNGSEPSPNFSSAEEEPILDPGLVFPKPTFSLGLSQEEPNNESSGCDVVNEESLVIALNKDDGVTVAEGDAPCHPFRKSKRQKVVPKALLGDYECDKKFLTRAWEAHVVADRTSDDMEVESKFCSERHSENPVGVDVLIHHTRSVYNSASDQLTTNQDVFFDTKFVAVASTRVARSTSLLTWIRHIGLVCALTPQVGSSMFWTATSLSAVM
uniref:DUF1985 domain-containing protein n=1 Tax=Brassica oleracea var. oleracea TaxID=109376 RepID=A0A0D3D516_BRAOL